MKTYFAIHVLFGVAVAMVAVTAQSEEYTGSWHIDEDQDRLILNFPGSRDKYTSSSSAVRRDAPRQENN